MSNSTYSAHPGLITVIRVSPIGLQAFIGFSLLASAASLVIAFLLPNEVKEAVIPNTGSLLGLMYAFNLVITLSNISTFPGLKKRIAVQFANVLLLVVSIVGQIATISNYQAEYADNPYLSVGPFRYIWAFVIPAIWIIVLLSPRITRFCMGK